MIGLVRIEARRRQVDLVLAADAVRSGTPTGDGKDEKPYGEWRERLLDQG